MHHVLPSCATLYSSVVCTSFTAPCRWQAIECAERLPGRCEYNDVGTFAGLLLLSLRLLLGDKAIGPLKPISCSFRPSVYYIPCLPVARTHAHRDAHYTKMGFLLCHDFLFIACCMSQVFACGAARMPGGRILCSGRASSCAGIRAASTQRPWSYLAMRRKLPNRIDQETTALILTGSLGQKGQVMTI